MASPMSYFRKHQKALLAAAGVIAIFAFILADPLLSLISSAAGGSSGVSGSTKVASWRGDDLNERELVNLVYRRHFVSNVLRSIQTLGAQRVYATGETPIPPPVPNFILSEDAPPESVQLGVVTTRVLAQLAQEAGMEVDDQVVLHYLREMGLNKVSDSEIPSLLQSIGGREGNSQFKEERLFAGLRELLLANQYMDSNSSAIRSVLPQERWDDWRRINERVAVDAIRIPAEKFLEQVPEPTEAELKAFYEEHKDSLSGAPDIVGGRELPSPKPGFKLPEKVVLKYLVGDPSDWSQKYLDEITDEEIADYYERNKRSQFVKASFGTDLNTEFDEGLFSGEEGEAAEAEEPSDTGTDAEGEDGAAEGIEEETEPATDQPMTEEAPAEETAEEAPETTDEVAEPSAEAADPSEAPAESTGESEATEEEEEEEEEEEAPASEVASESADGEAAEEGSGEDEPEPEYQPLEEVSEQIRAHLATEKAVLELEKLMQYRFTRLRKEYDKYGLAKVMAKEKKEDLPEPPAALTDLTALASETGLVSEETMPISALELRDMPVGVCVDSQTNRRYLVQAVFQEGGLELYEPFLGIDRLDGVWYLVVETKHTEEVTPPLEEIRDEVAAAWKVQQARKLAVEKAEQLAERAEKSSVSLLQLGETEGYEAVTTDLFSWLTLGTTPSEMQQGSRLGDAPPLEGIGNSFMETVFGLTDDKTAATRNHEGSEAYVVRVSHRESTSSGLRSRFLREANNWFGIGPTMQARFQSAQREVLDEILVERAGLDLEQLEKYLGSGSGR